MDSMSYRNNRPAQRPNEAEATPAPVPQPQPISAPAARTKRSAETAPKRKRPVLIIVAILAVLLLAFGAWYMMSRAGAAAAIDGSKYQAVFFTNGQVYFGKLASMNGDYMKLTNVYYLQTKADAEGKQASPQSASKQDASDVELIKLGNEIHGPDDEMIISKDQVLFFENLKPAGTVSQTITNFQKQKN